MKPLTTNEFISKSQLLYPNKFEYTKTSYVNTTTPVVITCKIHGDFTQIPNYHLTGASGCTMCGYGRKRKTFTTDDFIEKAKAIHGDTYDYSITKYVNMKTSINIICKHHGVITVNPDSHARGAGCRLCADIANSEKYTFSTDKFIEISTLKHVGRYTYTKAVYTKAIDKITITCPIHGDFEQTAISHMLGSGCKHCATSSACYTELPTILYYVAITSPEGITKYKVGITTKNITSRFSSELSLGYTVDIIDTVQVETGRPAFLCEQAILKELKHDRFIIPDVGVTFLYRGSGDTELLNNKLPTSLQVWVNNLKEQKGIFSK